MLLLHVYGYLYAMLSPKAAGGNVKTFLCHNITKARCLYIEAGFCFMCIPKSQ